MKALIYKQWRTERGVPEEVELIDIIDLVTINGSLYKFKQDEKIYVGEIWKVKRKNGTIMNCVIKTEHTETISEGEVGWEYKRSYSPECIDAWVNPLVDEWEVVEARITKNNFIREDTDNKGIRREEEKEQIMLDKLISFLNTIEKDSPEYKAGEAKLNFFKSPTIDTLKKWRGVSSKLKHKLILLCQ